LECHWEEHNTKSDQTDILLKKIRDVQEHYKFRGSKIMVDQNFYTDTRKITAGLIAKHEITLRYFSLCYMKNKNYCFISSSSSSSVPFTPCGAQGIHEERPSVAISSCPLHLIP
jgi:hypothetical protein